MFTKAQLSEFIQASPANAISYAVANNPKGAYNIAHAWHPNRFSDWERGLENNEGAQKQLFNFLTRMATDSGDAGAYALKLVNALPYNPDTTNDWTKITQ